MVYIIAEIGTSWEGDLTRLREMVMTCKKAGIDAVKMQAFKKEHLNSRYHRTLAAVTEFNVDVIDDLMRSCGMKWFCTAIYPESVDFLKDHVDMWKIRYKDSKNKDILTKVLAQKQLTFVSCEEPMTHNDQVQSMYCISKYPHLVHEIDWDKMKKFDGWSCHCASTEALKSAIKLGMKYLEIHIVPFSDDNFADDKVSFPMRDLEFIIPRLKTFE